MKHELFKIGSYDYSDLDERLDKLWNGQKKI